MSNGRNDYSSSMQNNGGYSSSQTTSSLPSYSSYGGGQEVTYSHAHSNTGIWGNHYDQTNGDPCAPTHNHHHSDDDCCAPTHSHHHHSTPGCGII